MHYPVFHSEQTKPPDLWKDEELAAGKAAWRSTRRTDNLCHLIPVLVPVQEVSDRRKVPFPGAVSEFKGVISKALQGGNITSLQRNLFGE